MPHPERPAVTIGGQADGPAADVITSGNDERRPAGSRRRTALLAGLAVGLLGGLLLSQRGAQAPPEPSDLRLVETGGDHRLSWRAGGALDISLPAHIANDGAATTVASMVLDDTVLAHPSVDVALAAGGRLPVTLRQTVDCARPVTLPADAALRLDVRRGGPPETRRIPLPDGVVASLRTALAEQCEQIPLDQAVVLRSEVEQVRDDAVVLRVAVDNISPNPVRILSIDPATGLGATLGSDGPTLPVLVGQEPFDLRLTVTLDDCAALALQDSLGRVGVADVSYDDGRGRRAVKAVVGDFSGLRAQVERTC